MCQTLRTIDMQGEGIVKHYLVRYFYEKIRNDGILPNITDYRSVNDINTQMQGVDTYLYSRDEIVAKVDEKSALYYINEDLNTFAFEISWERNGILTDGWFINDKLQTTHYFVMWLRGRPKFDEETGKELRKADYIRNMEINDIISVELYSINKQNLKNSLINVNLTEEKITRQADNMRNRNIRIKTFNKYIKLYYSSNLAEKPVNLVIKKEFLRSVPDVIIYEITNCQIKKNGEIIYEAP